MSWSGCSAEELGGNGLRVARNRYHGDAVETCLGECVERICHMTRLAGETLECAADVETRKVVDGASGSSGHIQRHPDRSARVGLAGEIVQPSEVIASEGAEGGVVVDAV